MKSNQNGFSLIEILFATAILGFILTAMLAIMLRSVNTLSEAKFRSNAVAIASSCLDQYRQARAAGWVRFCNETMADVACNAAPPDSTSTDAGNYAIRIETSACTDVRANVSVRVCWDRFSGNDTAENICDSGEETGTVTLEQIFFRYQDELSTS